MSEPPPGNDAYGYCELRPDTDVVAGEHTSWTITYTAGALGMDDGSTLKLATKLTSDWGPPQFEDPDRENYSRVHTSADATVEATHDPRGYRRPWSETVDVSVSEGTLAAGDTITIELGVTTGESPGIKAQTFVEDFRFRLLVDVYETGEYAEVPGDLTTGIVSGEPERLDALLPSTGSPGDETVLSVRVRDRWGNVARDYAGDIEISSPDDVSVHGDPTITQGTARVPVEFADAGIHRLEVDATGDDLGATTNPIDCSRGDDGSTYWGDLHGQSEETAGTGSIEEYFAFARDSGFLDFAAPANHDFQMSDAFWERVQEAVQEHHEEGEFVTFLSYEWSANTPAGGDHNVYFRGDEGTLHRVSDWTVDTGSTGHSEGVYPIEELYERFEGRDDVLVIPHQGGRPARVDSLDPELTPFVEILSLWGVFEWFGRDALEEGHRVGFVGGSDDTTGRLGANYPSSKDWYNIEGGLMAVYAPELTRDALWESFKRRRVYATTGDRILLETTIDGEGMGSVVTASGAPRFDVSVHGTAPIQRIDLFRGADPVAAWEPSAGSEAFEVVWTGLKSKTREKTVDWSGRLELTRGTFEDVAAFGFGSPTQGIDSVSGSSVRWTGATSGNYQGLHVVPDASPESVLTFAAGGVTEHFRLDELADGVDLDLGAVNRRVSIRPITRSTRLDVSTTLEGVDPVSDEHPYYVRVRQVDGEMAWSSPVFVRTE